MSPCGTDKKADWINLLPATREGANLWEQSFSRAAGVQKESLRSVRPLKL